MEAKDIVEELINDYKIISFGISYEYDLSPEDQIKNLRYCLHFCNQMVVNCTREYRVLYLECIKILNEKLQKLKK